MSYDDTFFGRVGHDLRGELATMLAGVHYLLRYESSLGGSAREMLDRVNGAGHRLKRLLGEFDNAIWLEPGRERQVPSEPYDLAELCATVIERVAHAAVSRDVTPVCDVPSGAELVGSSETLAVALEYVLELAVLRSRGGRVTLVGKVEAGSGVVAISDEGGPVPEEKLLRLGEPFVEKEILPRDDPAGKRRERLGLGLAIARGILVAHGGGFRVENRADGKGLLVTCTLGAPP
jgi:two-component system, OmpR family, sensor kinase